MIRMGSFRILPAVFCLLLPSCGRPADDHRYYGIIRTVEGESTFHSYDDKVYFVEHVPESQRMLLQRAEQDVSVEVEADVGGSCPGSKKHPCMVIHRLITMEYLDH